METKAEGTNLVTLSDRLKGLDNNLEVRDGLIGALQPGQSLDTKKYLDDRSYSTHNYQSLISDLSSYLRSREIQTDKGFYEKLFRAFTPTRKAKNIVEPDYHEKLLLDILTGGLIVDKVPDDVMHSLHEWEGIYFLSGVNASMSPNTWFDYKLTKSRLKSWSVTETVAWTIRNGIRFLEPHEQRLGKSLPHAQDITDKCNYAFNPSEYQAAKREQIKLEL